MRGQFLPLADAYLTASLAGINEVQPVPSDGVGAAKLVISGDSLYVVGSFSGLGSAFAAQIGGRPPAYRAGGHQWRRHLPLRATVAVDSLSGYFSRTRNAFGLLPAQKARLLADSLYVNIHSQQYRGGELRGQVVPEINFFPSADAAITQPATGRPSPSRVIGDAFWSPGWLPVTTMRWPISGSWQRTRASIRCSSRPTSGRRCPSPPTMPPSLLIGAGVPRRQRHALPPGGSQQRQPLYARRSGHGHPDARDAHRHGRSAARRLGRQGFPTITSHTYRVAVAAPDAVALRAWLTDAAGRPAAPVPLDATLVMPPMT